jgi:antitoxin component YwqK of YwqJK toxin-antitoxin module/tetratricopeptide (TPR) repeat protein
LNRAFLFLLLAPFTTTNSSAQEFLNSAEAIKTGIQFHNEGNYEEAIGQFLRVDQNDTNYNWMLAELCLSYLEDSSFEKAIEVCDRGLYLNEDNIDQFYNIKGTALDRMGEYEKGIAVFARGIERLPKSYLLRYNQGVTLENAKRYREAFESYKSVLRINPYHVGSHLKLGLMSAKQGELSRSGLSMAMAMILGASSEQAVNYLILGESMLKGDFEREELGLKWSTGEFQKTDLILRNRIALNRDYKLSTKLDFQIYRQLQVFFETLKFQAKSDDFWMQFYVPFFLDLKKDEQFEGFTYYTSQGINNPKAQKLVKKNNDKARSFENWTVVKMREHFGTHEENWDGAEQEVTYWYYRGNRLQAIGNKMGDQNDGYWEYYHWSGNLNSKGRFAEGQRSGPWVWFHPNDQVDERMTFGEAGKIVGVYESFKSNGSPSQKRVYQDGKLRRLMHFFPMGNKNTDIEFEDGQRNGRAIFYHGTDSARVRTSYLDGQLDGPYKEFYKDGLKAGEYLYTEGELDGAYKEFHANGQLRVSGVYAQGLAEGEWKYFHPNGKLRKKGSYKSGKSVGVWEEFFESGSPDTYTEFDQEGKEEGKLKQFNQEGKLVFELLYKKGELDGYSTYNAEGEVLNSAQIKAGKLWLDVERLDGSKWISGNYVRNQKAGEWKYYDDYGLLSTIENYLDGSMEGAYRSYHPNGQLQVETTYSNGSMDGYYKKYYANGQLEEEGWMKEGNRQGIWKSYYEEGTVSSEKYYMDDDQEGVQKYFNEDGKKYLENVVSNGYLMKVVEYDLIGDTLSEYPILDTTQLIEYHHPNGSVRMRGQYRNGYGHGPFQWTDGKGRVETEGQRMFGDDVGAWKWFYPDGQTSTQGSFVRDDRDGEWNWFRRDGSKSSTGQYRAGSKIGEWLTYYENGQVSSLKPYSYNKRHGKSYYYTENGELYLVRFHRNGKLIGYSYASGPDQLVDMIPIANGTAKVKATYPNGQTSASFEYRNSFLEGPFTTFYPDGQKMEESVFEHGELQGRSTEYYPSGSKRSEEEFYFGNRHGVCKYYHRNGKLKEEVNYILGRKYGTDTRFNEEGKVILKEIYHDGSLIE